MQDSDHVANNVVGIVPTDENMVSRDPELSPAQIPLQIPSRALFLKNLVKLAPRADVAEFRLGVCIPSVCTKPDLQEIVNEVSKLVLLNASAIRCETQPKKHVEVDQIIIITVYGIIGLLVFAGTSLELLLRFTKQEPIDDIYLQKRSMWIQSVVAFSIPRNTRKLLSSDPGENSGIACIRGMKFISICLYIVVWTYATPQDFHFLKYRSAFYFLKFMEEWWFSVFANSSAGIDTLFLIAGLYLSHQLWSKSNGQRMMINAPKFLLKWYSRFTLSHILVISAMLCLPLLGNGPIWDDVVTPIVQNCRERWWLNVFALNNFWESDTTCLSHTWLLSCLFHMVLISPILLFILSRSTTVGIFVNCIIIMGSCVAIAMVTLMNDLPPAPAFYFLSFVNVKIIWQKLFIQAYDHISPFCIGILLGFFFNRYDKMKLKKTTVLIGWVSAVACNLTVMCGLYGYRNGEQMEMSLSAVYAAVHRLVWSLGISWMIFACFYGYGGFVNSILSWKFFIPCDRISALIYILHPLILLLHEGQLREKMYMGHFEQVMYATAYIVFTIALATLCYVICVAPYLFFEKKLWREPQLTSNVEEVESGKEKSKEHFEEKKEIYKEKKKFQFFRQSITITPK
ncbi:nose resistant to fluoxetine protein 6 [Trichonephila clavipes]|nr:nose resistant to fluoxetine protein 6 [Trichonephila clavipes]